MKQLNKTNMMNLVKKTPKQLPTNKQTNTRMLMEFVNYLAMLLNIRLENRFTIQDVEGAIMDVEGMKGVEVEDFFNFVKTEQIKEEYKFLSNIS